MLRERAIESWSIIFENKVLDPDIKPSIVFDGWKINRLPIIWHYHLVIDRESEGERKREKPWLLVIHFQVKWIFDCFTIALHSLANSL